MVHIGSIIQTLKSLRTKQYSCTELVQTLEARCKAAKLINALVATDWDQLQRQARKVDQRGSAGVGLCGIPLCFKANIATGVFPTSAATPGLMSHVPKTASDVVSRLLSAGALLGASGNMHELSFGITSNNYATGAVRNPWNTNMIAGGSSGGVAAAAASRLMLAGIGTDTGASVRLPAALCGVVGFRPTLRRYPIDGIIPVSPTRDTVGIIAQNVPDVVLLDRVISKTAKLIPRIALKGLRLGLPTSYFYDNLESDVALATEATIRLLAKKGVVFVDADIPDLGHLNNRVSLPIALYEFPLAFQKYLNDFGQGLSFNDVVKAIRSPDVAEIIHDQIEGAQISRAEYLQACQTFRPQLQAAYQNYFVLHQIDAIFFPTAPLTAKPIGEDRSVMHNGLMENTFRIYVRNVDPSSNAGLPGLSLPVSVTSDGLPVGIEIDGFAGSDERLLAIGAALEEALEFRGRPSFPEFDAK
nr:indole acetimide hydrolase [Ipomoea batatas]